MKHAFPWFVVHKSTRFIVAGFVNFDEAERFCAAFSHGMYVVVSGVEIAAAN